MMPIVESNFSPDFLVLMPRIIPRIANNPKGKAVIIKE
jgi:hypothetical protein